MFDDEPYGYDHDGDGWLDGEDRGSFYDFDFNGDGDIDADDDFYGDMMMYEAGACFIATAVYGDYDHPQVRKLRVIVKRTLRLYGYPPDMQKLATETVLKQAELIADELVGDKRFSIIH